MSECLMTIMSAQYSHRTGVQVSFVRDENKRGVFLNCICRLLALSLSRSLSESRGIVLAANAGPRVPRGGVTLKRRCIHRPSVIYLIVNKLVSLSLSLLLARSLSRG